MANNLVTGLPGASKTLYTLWTICRPLVGKKLKREDQTEVPIRLVVGGVRDLLLEHEPIDVPTFDQESGKLRFGEKIFDPDTEDRKPGDPPHDCHRRADNWWRWCQPGDVIVVDECQRLFRPMASGRKLPKFITMLEIHRHYGVEFVFITQHPQLIHANCRNLIGRHEHIRRIAGSKSCIVYEWDICTHPDKVKTAAAKHFRHDKRAYQLYKSAELHIKSKQRLPAAIWLMPVALVVLIAVGWTTFGRWQAGQKPITPVILAASAPGMGVRHERTAPVAMATVQASAPAATLASQVKQLVHDKPKYLGCINMPPRCECIDAEGVSQEVELKFCLANSTRGGIALPYKHGPQTPAPAVPIIAKAEPIPGLLSMGGENGGYIKGGSPATSTLR